MTIKIVTEKPFAPACERNREPILAALGGVFTEPAELLEIGSGTGQHAVYFGARLPRLRWQTSDVAGNLPGIRLWLAEAALDNVPEPLELDVAREPWPVGAACFDGAFSANTAHIMSWPQVEQMFAGVARALRPGGRFCLYGPFRYHGEHTSVGNARFDAALRAGGDGGIRDVDDLTATAGRCGIELQQDIAMPANNRLLVWRAGHDGPAPSDRR